MTGKILFGNSGDVAKIPGKIYVGDSSDKAKLIEKVYVGDGSGIARKVWPVSMLPVAYQQVEYIQNSGSVQYLDPDIYPDSDTHVHIDYAITSYSNMYEQGRIFGCWNEGYTTSSGSGTPDYTFRYVLYASSNRNQWGLAEFGGSGFGNQGDYFNLINSSRLNVRTKVDYLAPGGKFLVDGVEVASTTKTFSNYDAYLGKNKTYTKSKIFIFASQWLNRSYSNTMAYYSGEFKLYHFTVSQNGTAVRDMYPSYRKSDNVIGMYDTVNKVFYTNQGTGTFYKGPNV